MKITSREKTLIILLIVVALIVLMFPSDEDITFNQNLSVSKTVTKILITKYSRIRPFELPASKAYQNSNFVLKRNIFQYGFSGGSPGNQTQKPADESVDKKEKKEVKQGMDGETLPEIDFKVIGIIRVSDRTRAIVVTKGPELFVFKEGDTLFDRFILKKVEKNSVVLGFKGFKETKTINLENKGGF